MLDGEEPQVLGCAQDDKGGGSMLSCAAVMLDGQNRKRYQSGDVRNGRLA